MTGGGAVPFLMTVVAAASWGVANIVSKKAGRVDMLGFIVWSSLVAPLPLLGLSLWLDGPDRGLDGADADSMAAPCWPWPISPIRPRSSPSGSGPISCRAIRRPRSRPSRCFVPVAGILGSALILGEAMHPIEAVGGAVIVLGLAFNIFGPRLMRRMVSNLSALLSG